MKKIPRVLLNLLLPPGVAAVLLAGAMSIVQAELMDLRYAALLSLYAYAFASVPCVTHTLTMEFCYRRGLLPTRWKAVAFSTVSGAISGVLVVVGFGIRFGVLADLKSAFLIYSALGAATGAVTAIIIKMFARTVVKGPTP